MGTVVISLDAELAWGFHDLEDGPDGRIGGARDGWRALLALFDEFEIPATWGIVGHLFLDECDGRHGSLAAPDGWFSNDPGGRADDRSVRFAPDLVRAVRDAAVGHEIATHTFSHVEFGQAGTTRAMAASELRESTRLADAWDLDVASMIFPRNTVGHRDVLSEFGIRAYRGRSPDRWYHGRRAEPAWKSLSLTLGRDPPVVTPSVDRFGLVNIPASLYLFCFEGLPRRLADRVVGDPVVRAAKRGIDAAAASDGTCHLWLHPNNLRTPADIERVRSVLEYLAATVSTTGLEVATMDDVARRTLAAAD